MFNFKSVLKFPLLTKLEELLKQKTPVQVMGLNANAVGAVCGVLTSSAVIVAKDLVSSGKIAQTLAAFGYNVKFLTVPFENNLSLVDNNIKDDFFFIINDFIRGKIDFVIAMPEVLFQKIPTKTQLLNNSLNLKIGTEINFSTLSQSLINLGYERVDFVMSKGEFSVKGDTVLIAPLGNENLIRLEFFGDEIERISEILFEERKFKAELDCLELYARDLPLSENNLLSLTDTVFFDEPKQIEEHLESFEWQNNFVTIKKATAVGLGKKAVSFSNLTAKTFFKPFEFLRLQAGQSKSYVFSFQELVSDLNFYKNSDREIYLFCGSEKNKKILETYLEDNFIFTKNIKGESTNIHLTTEYLPHSINFALCPNILIGTLDLFKKEKLEQTSRKKKIFVPKVNEFVVHEKHGIGKCIGIEKLKISGYEKDYIIIEYAGGDKFYLPSEQADSLSLYSTNAENPKLNKLGGVDFARVKEKVFKNVKELAFDLLKLYAKREQSVGKVYQKDDYLMQEFEEAFEHDETPDQLKAIEDIKADMESKRVMDRLVCGDVGFGKTEVALRAIYKAVLSGSQVAFICPTTILAEQHYQTCLKRFSGFMVNVAKFHRLISKKEENAVMKGLADGTINVVCGTHKLLSEKLKFKNLTLLVLDEEQRFGVEDKEKIKNIKNNIDVLSLSATPIPRTLHMSLSGIRDISIIDTPPKERHPVQTFVTEFDETLIKNACIQELSRGGQVIIIYNRIDTIYDFAEKIRGIVPDVSVGVTHGRLTQKQLEDSILRLYSGETRILISTTLVENGINLPGANTLIVINADMLGLSQAYQIRGRIGRADKIAYAYFLFDKGKRLTDGAFQRLTALMENTSLGSGYKIAMADLDIRGAGNVLGKEQHGNMVKVGYDLYYRLLNVALKEIKGEKTENKKEVRLDIEIDAFVPEYYAPNEDERLKIITNISEINSEKTASEVKESLYFTYGKPPKEVQNLIMLALLKSVAEKAGVKRILINANACNIYFYEKKEIILNEFGTKESKMKAVFDMLVR